MWTSDVLPALKPLIRAIYAVPHVVGPRDGALVLAVPNEPHRKRCEQHRGDVEAVIARLVSNAVKVELVVDASPRHDDHNDTRNDTHSDTRNDSHNDGQDGASGRRTAASVVELHPRGAPPADDEVDLTDLVDAPPESVVSPIDRLAQAFPGSELMDEQR
jgi:DNA polymerase-3 subunit gamma/tau